MSFEITAVHGRTQHYTINLEDQTGQPLDLTSGELVLAFKFPASDEVAFTKVPDFGIIYDDDVTGQADLEITADDLDGADVPNEWGTLYGDATFWTDEGGMPALIGQLRIIPSIGEAVGS